MGVAPPRIAAGKHRSVRAGIAALTAAVIAAVLLWLPWQTSSDSFAGGAEGTTTDVPEVAGVRDVRGDDALPLEEPDADAPSGARESAAEGEAQSEAEAGLARPNKAPFAADGARETRPAANPAADEVAVAPAQAVGAAERSAVPDPSVGSTAVARNEIRSAIGGYARAVESRDIRRLRRMYPQLTREQERNWREFFASVRDLSAELNVASLDVLDVANSTAVVRVTGTYSYRNQTLGRDERSPVDFEATLRRGSRGWFFSSVR